MNTTKHIGYTASGVEVVVPCGVAVRATGRVDCTYRGLAVYTWGAYHYAARSGRSLARRPPHSAKSTNAKATRLQA